MVNPHHHAYYADLEAPKKDAFPSECEDPKPSLFLCLRAGLRFVVRVASRDPGLLDPIHRYLVPALRDLGFGAKTSLGYGRMGKRGREITVEVRDGIRVGGSDPRS